MGREGAIPGTSQGPSQDPYLVIYSASGPTHGRMKAISVNLMRFLRIGSRMGPEKGPDMASDDPP